MLKRHSIIASLVFCISFFSCKRFDSNQYNYNQIQGEWELCSVQNKSNNETLPIDNLPILYFDDQKRCEETFQKTNFKNVYSYSINNYFITFQDSIDNNLSYYRINKLTKDSLILESASQLFNYVAKKR